MAGLFPQPRLPVKKNSAWWSSGRGRRRRCVAIVSGRTPLTAVVRQIFWFLGGKGVHVGAGSSLQLDTLAFVGVYDEEIDADGVAVISNVSIATAGKGSNLRAAGRRTGRLRRTADRSRHGARGARRPARSSIRPRRGRRTSGRTMRSTLASPRPRRRRSAHPGCRASIPHGASSGRISGSPCAGTTSGKTASSATGPTPPHARARARPRVAVRDQPPIRADSYGVEHLAMRVPDTTLHEDAEPTTVSLPGYRTDTRRCVRSTGMRWL